MALPIAAAIDLAAEFAPGMSDGSPATKPGKSPRRSPRPPWTSPGTASAEEAAAALRANPELALAFRQHMSDVKVKLETAYLADRQDARARDVAIRQAGQRNTRADLMAAGAGVVLLACRRAGELPDGAAGRGRRDHLDHRRHRGEMPG